MKHWDLIEVVNCAVIVVLLTLFILYCSHQLKVTNIVKSYEVSIEDS